MSGGRVPVPGLDFTAIDFETANGFRGSACAVGLVRVRDGRMTERAAWLMRPPAGFDRFDPRNTRIHGIRPADVADAADWTTQLAGLTAFIGDDVLVGEMPVQEEHFDKCPGARGIAVGFAGGGLPFLVDRREPAGLAGLL